MQWLPAVFAGLCTLAISKALIVALGRAGIARENYRGQMIPTASGLVVVAAVLISLMPLTLIQEIVNKQVFFSATGSALIYVLGVCLLGLIDDSVGGVGRGIRGHIGELKQGRFSTGLLKAVGSFALALYIFSGQGTNLDKYLLQVMLLVLTTNLFNLLDLKPGRALKFFLILGALVWVSTKDTETVQLLGLFSVPLVLLLAPDLRQRAMLGDTGSNLVGAVAGLWLVFSLSTEAQVVVLGVLIVLTIYGEFRSLGKLIEKTPLLRALDYLGRQ